VLDALATRVIAESHLVRAPGNAPLVLEERGQRSTCENTPVHHRGAYFGVKLRGNEHLRCLRGRPEEDTGFCNLPDYLIFSSASSKRGEPILRVLLVEMKSGGAGRSRAMRQLQLGVPVAGYLAALARLDAPALALPAVHQAGVILSPDLPAARVKTRRGQFGYDPVLDAKTGIYLYDAPCGEDLYLDQFSYVPARI